MNPDSERIAPRSRWTSFLADPGEDRPRILYKQGNPAHRLRVEHNQHTLLVHLSDEDSGGWTVVAIDRATRRWAVAQARRQLDAAEDAYSRLYSDASEASDGDGPARAGRAPDAGAQDRGGVSAS